MEADAMYMKFEGVRGTCCRLGVFVEEGESDFLGVEGFGDSVRAGVTLFTASTFVAANGGGNGDIESPETEALWA